MYAMFRTHQGGQDGAQESLGPPGVEAGHMHQGHLCRGHVWEERPSCTVQFAGEQGCQPGPPAQWLIFLPPSQGRGPGPVRFCTRGWGRGSARESRGEAEANVISPGGGTGGVGCLRHLHVAQISPFAFTVFIIPSIHEIRCKEYHVN